MKVEATLKSACTEKDQIDNILKKEGYNEGAWRDLFGRRTTPGVDPHGFEVQDYALWDVIENGNSFKPVAQTTTNADGTSTSLIPGLVTIEEKAQKKNDCFRRLGLSPKIAENRNQATALEEPVNVEELLLKPWSAIDCAATYKRGLASVEEQLVFYKKNEVIFCEQLAVLKRDISYKDSEISMLKSELEKLKQEKESNQLKIENFDNASKSLDKLIGSQIPDKSRKGLGFVSYNVVPPPPTGLFSPPNLDLSNSGLEEFQQPEFEGYGPKTSKNISEDTSNEVRESPDAPMVEKLVSDDKLEKKTVFPTVAKIEFVRPKQQEKPVRKPVKYAEMYRFTWVLFLATKDETSGILKRFITAIENLVGKKVKIIRCDNGTEFKNRVMSEFCKQKGIKREFNVAKTPQQNSVVERRNSTLIEAARTIGRTPALSFMRPFGCHVTILNTLDYLGKFDGKFLEDKPIIAGDGPKWLFDIDVMTKSMNYVLVIAGTNSNDLVDGSLFDSSLKNASNDKTKPSSDARKKDDEGCC
ncbi:ribonuclease H-like domain-containing protein [Tanacetum coccineum]